MTKTKNTKGIELTFNDVELLIYSLCHKWRRKGRGNYEDLLSAAQEEFIEAYLTFDSGSSQFSTWITNHINWRLGNEVLFRQRERLHRCNFNLENLPGKCAWSRERFVEELSNDGRYIIKIAWGVLSANFPPGRSVRVILVRNETKRVLLELGWQATRVTKAFLEVKGALR